MRFTRNKLSKLAILVFWLIIWEILALIVNQTIFLPSPIDCIVELVKLLPTIEFWTDIGASFLRMLIGLVISLTVGFGLGYLASKIKLIYSILSPFMTTVKTVPVMSVILLFIVIMKSNIVPIVVCTTVCLPIAYTNIVEGFKSIDTRLIEMGKVFKLSNRRILFDITIPMLKPSINTALMLCIGFSWKTIVTAEVLSIPANSIGYNLYLSKTYLDTTSLFAWTIAIVMLSVLMEKLIKKFFNIKGVENDKTP